MAFGSVTMSVWEADDELGRVAVPAGFNEATLDLEGRRVSNLIVRLELGRGDADISPVVYRWRLRGFPIAPPTQQWLVPIRLYEYHAMNDSQGQVRSFDPLAEVDSIVEMWETKRQVLYREGERTYRVRVDAYEYQPSDWTDDGQFVQGTLLVRLVET